MRGILVAAAILVVSACATPPSLVPCYDGWTTDESGSSKLWKPSAPERAKLMALLEPGEQLACVHRMPSGKFMLVTREGHVTRTLDVRASDGEFEAGERGVVVQGD